MHTDTSLRLKTRTKEKLEVVREEIAASSFDETVDKLIEEHKLKVSMFGADPDLSRWNRKTDRARFRTHHNR